MFVIKSHIIRQVLCSLPGYLFALCFGISFNVPAVMLPQLREDTAIHYEASHESWIASITAISMVIGSIVTGQIIDQHGRKIAHISMGIPYIVGWITALIAPSTNFIILGRFLTGFSSGTVRTIVCVYTGEIVFPKNRATALVMTSILFYIGTLMSHLIAHYFHWTSCAFLCIAMSVVGAISSIFLKESPIWLISKGKTDEGKEMFRWFRGDDHESENELNAILSKQANNTENTVNIFKVLTSSAFVKPMAILLVVMTIVQLSGVNAIEFYAQDIFEETFSGHLDPFLVMISMDCIVGLVSAIVCFLGNYIPKKKLFLSSCFGVTLFVAGLVVSLFYVNFIWLSVLCLVIFLCFATFVVTLGFTFVPEILPSSVRGLGSGISLAFSYTVTFLVAKLIPDVMRVFGTSVLFSVFGVSSFICGVILCFVLPDTDGKTLQSIEDNFNKTTVELDQVNRNNVAQA